MDGNLTVHNAIHIQVPTARDVKYSCKYISGFGIRIFGCLNTAHMNR